MAAEEDEDLDLKLGDIVAVTNAPDDGWWSGELVNEAKGSSDSARSTPVAQVKKAVTATEPAVGRVRALYTFEATDPEDLGFNKGEVIKVHDKRYKDWWRGELKGRTGIFPVNYVVCFIWSCWVALISDLPLSFSFI